MKKMRAAGIALLGLSLGLVACFEGNYEYANYVIETLLPLVAEGQGVSEPGLVGDWILAEEESQDESATEDMEEEESRKRERQKQEIVIRFTAREKDNDCNLLFVRYDDDPENPDGPLKEVIRSRNRCRLIWLGRSLFLDVVSREQPSHDCWIPSHGIYRVELNSDEMYLGAMTREWLEKRIEEQRVRVPYARITKGAIVLTGTTDELQEFFTDYAWDDEAFERAGPFRRKAEPPKSSDTGGAR